MKTLKIVLTCFLALVALFAIVFVLPATRGIGELAGFYTDTTPEDISWLGTCAQYMKTQLPCGPEDEGQINKSESGERKCKEGWWYIDRSGPIPYNDAGPPYDDRCRYVEGYMEPAPYKPPPPKTWTGSITP